MKTYIVARRDCWQTLSARFGLPVCLLLRANGGDARLYPGRRIVIPPPSFCLRRAEHIVQPDETLFQIAQENRITQWHLVRENRLRPPYAIVAGQRLILPRPPAGTRIVTLTALDTLSQTAKRLGVLPAALRTLNGLPENDEGHPGLQLYCPDSTLLKYCPV
ncbi:MAG: LysM peptidoglycan-binding domain-containing protein [Clostridia bacterium]|nr:LysM peptidoglycan-binding domain-containing protein [Clostridia bacterium]